VIKTNAIANAILFPEHWGVPLGTYLDIADILIRHCPRWADYYKSELTSKNDKDDVSMLELIEARRKVKKDKRF
jgi:hypothetical protein